MARIRTIKPDFCSSKDVGAISRDARLFFLQLLTEADDDGRMLWIPRRLCGVLYPFDDDVGAKDLELWADECERRHMVLRYAADGVKYLAVVNWAKHQRISHASDSKYPPPPLNGSVDDPERAESAAGNPPEDFRPEGEGEREEEQGKGVPPSAERKKALATVAPVADDPIKDMFDGAIAYMGECGVKDKQARSMIAFVRKALHDDVATAELLTTMQSDRIINPQAWLAAATKRRSAKGGQHNKQAALEERNRQVGDGWASQGADEPGEPHAH